MSTRWKIKTTETSQTMVPVLSVVLLVYIISVCSGQQQAALRTTQSTGIIDSAAKQRLLKLLFPRANVSLPSSTHAADRRLFGEFVPNSESNCGNIPKTGANGTVIPLKSAPCIKCTGLSYCKILNGLIVEEVYYPNNLDLRGTCTIIEGLGNQMANEIFGVGRTFRDTPQCRGS